MFKRPPKTLFEFSIDGLETFVHEDTETVAAFIDMIPEDVVRRIPCRALGSVCGELPAVAFRTCDFMMDHMVCVLDAARSKVANGVNYAISRRMTPLLVEIAAMYPEEAYTVVRGAVIAGDCAVIHTLISRQMVDEDTVNGIAAEGVLVRNMSAFYAAEALGKAFEDRENAKFIIKVAHKTSTPYFVSGLWHAYLQMFPS